MKMKSIISGFVFIVIIAIQPGCKKYLQVDPLTGFGPETVFGSVTNARMAVLGAYQRLTGDIGYGSRLSIFFPYDTDIMMGANGNGDNGRKDMNRYNLTPTNNELEAPFERLFQGVERANICIKYIPKMELYENGTDMEKAKLRRLYGEALTLRAQCYTELVRNWGDLPAQWLPSEDQPNLFLAKTDRDSIYDHLLADLKEAEALVPWRSELAAIGDPIDERITKGAVKGLRARIAMYRGGYSLRRDNTMKRGSNHLQYYQIAADETLDIIESQEHKLAPDYRNLWKNSVNAHRLDPDGEIIFEIALIATDGKIGYFNGVEGGVMVVPTYFYSFDSLDTRRDVIAAPFTVNADGTLKGTNLTQVYEGIYRRNWVSNPSFDNAVRSQFMGLNWPVIRYSDVLLMYAEADNELNNGPSAKAIEVFEQVRKRGFGSNQTEIGVTPTDKDGFFNAIVNERAFELGGEGVRKYDLIRWNLLATKLDETKAKLAAMAARQAPYDVLPQRMYFLPGATENVNWVNSFYKPSPASAPPGTTSVNWVTSSLTTTRNWGMYAQGFKANHSEIFPIPQSAIDANPSLTQDFGY